MPQKQTVTLTTATKLSAQQKAKVVAEIKKKIGVDFELKELVDPKVIGGIKIGIGQKEFDITIAGKLKELANQIITAEVVTAVPLTTAQRKKISQTIEKKHGPIEIIERVDPLVIGGIRLRVGSNEYDATILAKLEKLRSKLIQ